MRHLLVLFLLVLPTQGFTTPAVTKTQIGNEYVGSFPKPLSDEQIATLYTDGWSEIRNLGPKSKGASVYLMKLPSFIRDGKSFVVALQQKHITLWVEPNYLYTGEVLDVVENFNFTVDPLLPDQFHHKTMKSAEAWQQEKGQATLVVAVTDDGFDLNHEDLIANFASNNREIAGNGIDDDQNGYVDDVRGWDFVENDNQGEPSGDHGTHCAGIVAATGDNGIGISGTAPGARVLPLKIYDYNSLSSAVMNAAFRYAADNGAKIITTSYAVDAMVNDKVYRDGVTYAYNQGVLHFNSAGNNSQEDPPRAMIQELVLVASTHADGMTDDELSYFSNYGKVIHVAAPGGNGDDYRDILSTVTSNGYERKAGTSMASPNAAGVAALIWSRHPTWSRAQVLAQLLGTADKIEQKNSSDKKDKMGAGRVNSFEAVTGAPFPVTFMNPTASANSIQIFFRGVLSAASAQQAENYKLTYAGADKIFGTADDADVNVKIEAALDTSRYLQLDFDGKAGLYRLEIRDSLVDPFGTAIDGNADGVAGGRFTYDFQKN